MKNIYNAQDEFEANMIISKLEDADIKAYFRDKSYGEYLTIATGFSVYGKDIIVDDDNYDKAIKIIENVVKERSRLENDIEDINIKTAWYKNKRIIARIILSWAIIGLIVYIIMEMRM